MYINGGERAQKTEDAIARCGGQGLCIDTQGFCRNVVIHTSLVVTQRCYYFQ